MSHRFVKLYTICLHEECFEKTLITDYDVSFSYLSPFLFVVRGFILLFAIQNF